MSAANTRSPFPGRDRDELSLLSAFRPGVAKRAGSANGSGQTVAPFPRSGGEVDGGAGVRRQVVRNGSNDGGLPPIVKSPAAKSARLPSAGTDVNSNAEGEDAPVERRAGRAFSPRQLRVGAGLLIALIGVMAVTAWLADRRLPAINPDFPGGFAVPVGGVMPEFSASLVQGSVAPYGTVFSNFDLYGRVSVFVVWASWDPQSIEWIDRLQLMRLTDFYDQSINWVGVNYHDHRAEALRVVEQTRTADWPHLWLPQETTLESASLRQLGFSWAPAIYVFDPQGQLRYMGWSPAEMNEMLESLSF